MLCWSVVVFPESAPVPSSSQPKKQTYRLQRVLLLGEDLVISPTREVGVIGWILEGSIVKGPGKVLGYLFVVSQSNLSALEKS